MSDTAGKRALVTGATGFIGSHLVRRLKAHGWQTHAIVRPGSRSAGLAELLGAAHVHPHDGSMEGMGAIVRAARPTVIFHLASLFLAQHRTEDVTALMRSNVEFGAQLAEAAAVCRVPHFINTGTAWQHFGNADFNPVNLYAATKQALAGILRYYAEAGALRVATLELFDTYGPGDPRPKLFSMLRKAAAGGAALAMSGGEQLIDLVYIDDVLEAYMAAAAEMARGARSFATYAVGAGTPMRLRDVVERWQQVTGRRLTIAWGARPYRPREVMVPWSGGKPVPGWRAQVGLEEGIGRMESESPASRAS